MVRVHVWHQAQLAARRAACLWVFIWSFGHVISPIDLLTAYGLANILAAIPITPAGLGIIEDVLIPTLVGFGVPHSQAILAVLSYRLINFWIPIPVGGISYASLAVAERRTDSRLSQSPGPEQRQPDLNSLWAEEVVDRLQSSPTAIRSEDPRVEIITPRDLRGLEQFLLKRSVLDRHLDLDAAMQVAFHEVGRSSFQIENSGSPGVSEDGDPASAQGELTDQAAHRDVLRQSRAHAGRGEQGRAHFETDLDPAELAS